MNGQARSFASTTLLVAVGAFLVPAMSQAQGRPFGLPDSAPPAGLPDSAPPFGLPGSAPPFGLPDSAPPFGKGKDAGVATISYHCLGIAKRRNSKTSPYSYLADSIVVDAGGSETTLEGAATGDLVSNDVGVVPTHMAGASISAAGLSLQSFDSCGASAQSVLSSAIVGTDASNPDSTGAAYAEIKVNYHAQLETHGSQGPAGIFSAFTETTLEVIGIRSETFTVSANGQLVDAPPGLTVTDLSNGDHHVYQVSGTYTVPVQLFYGNGISNIVLTSFEAAGAVSQVNVRGSKIIAGFAAAEALDTLTFEVVSLDPHVSFTFLPTN